MNIPNKLTLARVLLVPFLILFLLNDKIENRYLFALIVFALSSATDHLDGKIARKTGQITDFGKFADPIADKIMVISALMCFVELRLIGAVAVIIIISREFVVTSIRLIAASSGKVIAANNWGKAKTISQIIAIIVIITLQCINEIINININENILNIVNEVSIWFCTIITIISGVIYVWDNRQFVKNAK